MTALDGGVSSVMYVGLLVQMQARTRFKGYYYEPCPCVMEMPAGLLDATLMNGVL